MRRFWRRLIAWLNRPGPLGPTRLATDKDGKWYFERVRGGR